MEIEPYIPDYQQRNIKNLLKEILGTQDFGLLSRESKKAKIKVLLVLDGLGYHQLLSHIEKLKTLASFNVSVIDSVLPTTTAAALTSITTTCSPSEHGLLGYRMLVGNSSVLNVLRWQIKEPNDAISLYDPVQLQPIEPFLGSNPSIVTRSEFKQTGFTLAHLRASKFFGWRVTSSIPVMVKQLISEGERFIYVYYDGIDKAAHEHGLGDFYKAELEFVDSFVAKLINCMPNNSCLIITSDHGQVEIQQNPITLEKEIMACVSLMSGEGRFRWIHAKHGLEKNVYEALKDSYSELAWVKTKQELIDQKWFGAFKNIELTSRLGDVALIAKKPVAFLDPDDVGELKLVSRHGSATIQEVQVPLMQLAK